MHPTAASHVHHFECPVMIVLVGVNGYMNMTTMMNMKIMSTNMTILMMLTILILEEANVTPKPVGR